MSLEGGWWAMDLKRTPLYEMHQKYGGRIVDFGGWALPVQFSSILEEHRAVRERAGLFDVSHMGEIKLTGPQALAVAQRLVTNDVAALADQQILYSPMCYAHGGIVDDLLVYRRGPEDYLLVVNAANTDKDYLHVSEVARQYPGARVENSSDATAQLALQGPRAERILQRLTGAPLAEIKYYWFRPEVEVAGVKCLVSRTGYTGEDGFELYCSPTEAPQLWETLLEEGDEDGLVPCGLGARDTLRFEARLPLYGHELSDQSTPLEAGLGVFVKLGKEGFLGQPVLVRQQQEGVKRKLAGFEMLERGIPRAQYPIALNGEEVGFVTSGTFAPTLEKNLGLGYVPVELAGVGSEFDVVIREKPTRARVVKTPFYRRPKG